MVGPELPNMSTEGESEANPGYGRHTQGGAMEHLAHVIYGFQDLDGWMQDNSYLCKHFLPSSECPGSPCQG